MVGKPLGHYEVLEPLGAGGMGEVYRAHDPNLKRDVAIKVLPEALADDPERLARLEREAHSLASLNHPNVATIHGLESADGIRFLVLELVEGETLADWIEAGPVELDDALRAAVQIAEGLEAAHANGIIHRDLKPANVKVTPEGRVKVLDFGLAKATDPVAQTASGPDALTAALTHSPTITAGATAVGVLLGTAPYMSPEQAKGKLVDKRTDIWAFGCVLYEMLTGTQPFIGEEVSDTIASILKEEPDWEALPVDTPIAIQSLLRRCLRKDVDRRLRDIGDVRIEIEDVISEPADAVPEAGWGAVDAAPRWQRIAPWAALGMVMGMVAGIMADRTVLQAPTTDAAGLVETSIFVPATQTPNTPRISPDGTRIVYRATEDGVRQLFSRLLSEDRATPIPGTEGALVPRFSPGGDWIGFYADGQVKKASLDGGVAAIELAAAVDPGASYRSLAWGPDDSIVFLRTLEQAGAPGLVRMSAGGEAMQTVLPYDLTRAPPQTPEVLPGGRAFLYSQRVGSTPIGSITLKSFSADDAQVLARGSGARYVSTGHIVYLGENRTLYALPFDLETLEATSSTSFPVRAGVDYFDVSSTGTLIYKPTVRVLRELVLIDLQGNSEALVGMPAGSPSRARFSPDGRFFTFFAPAAPGIAGAYLYDLETEESRFLFSSIDDDAGTWIVSAPANWSPDGTRLSVAARQDDNDLNWEIFIRPLDGSPAERLLSGPGAQYPHGWVPSSGAEERLLFTEMLGGDDLFWKIWEVPLQPAETPRLLIEVPGASAENPAVSPDGQWIAYDAGQAVFVKRYDALGPGRQVSGGEGRFPVWAPNGATLYYQSGPQMIAVAITTDPVLEPGGSGVLFGGLGGYRAQDSSRPFDLSPDGDRFVISRPLGDSGPRNEIRVVQNWFEELRQRTGAGR